MITITCTNCRNVLEIDEAFAGGVCRCIHCGTIQTVPSLSRRPGRPGSPVDPTPAAPPPAPVGAGKAIYQAPASGSGLAHSAQQEAPPPAPPPSAPATPSTGLEDLAAAVASSGLTGTGLRSGRLRKSGGSAHGVAALASDATATAAAFPGGSSLAANARSNAAVLLVGAGAGVLVLAGVLVGYLVSRDGPSPTPAQQPAAVRPAGPTAVNPAAGASGAGNGGGASGSASASAADSQRPGAAARGSSFMGHALVGPSVVYLIDRGQGSADVFGQMRYCTASSIQSLGPAVKFQVRLWQTTSTAHFPGGGTLVEASDANKQAALAFLDNAFAAGASSVELPLTEVLKQNPAEVVLATGKDDLNESWAEGVLSIVRAADSKARIYAFAVGDPAVASRATCDALAKVAAATGGQFHKLDADALARILRSLGG